MNSLIIRLSDAELSDLGDLQPRGPGVTTGDRAAEVVRGLVAANIAIRRRNVRERSVREAFIKDLAEVQLSASVQPDPVAEPLPDPVEPFVEDVAIAVPEPE